MESSASFNTRLREEANFCTKEDIDPITSFNTRLREEANFFQI